MTVVANDILRVTSQMLADGGGVLQNVYHYRAPAGFSESDSTVMNSVSSKLDSAYNALVGRMSNLTTLDRHLYQVSRDGGVTFDDLGEWAMGGSSPAAVAENMPHAFAPVVTFGGKGRGSRGKKYLHSITEGDQTNGFISVGLGADIVNYANLVDDSVGFTSGALEAGWMGVNPLAFIPYDGTHITSFLGSSQYRRKQGIGA